MLYLIILYPQGSTKENKKKKVKQHDKQSKNMLKMQHISKSTARRRL
jgi:hypothetical protein